MQTGAATVENSMEFSEKIKNETSPPTYTIHEDKLKWIKDLTISQDTIKILVENIGSKISDISRSNIFAYISPRVRETKKKINKCNHSKLKTCCKAKKTQSKIKRECTV